ncbi:hypothetical protein HG535_0D03580 [Zygotorulaspora mrakii]|uniref:Smr domain-containing protein n=1 Tax=Zygotorulaspora mrakii TaxID=42260 RepID=A0A7H9B204_ZYGMR|nr:uncharacterized protein HG535_0D03580 [Zygotorulaspora mrakii]QLG72650.1 hypothetical protein HG535_0D03580 [Zygotorulaspora mrakii]
MDGIINNNFNTEGQINEYEEKIAELCDIFPDKSQTEIQKAFLSSNKNLPATCELLLTGHETLLKESDVAGVDPQVNRKQEFTPVDELGAMFPNIDRKAITTALQSNKNSLDDTIGDLLNFDILSVEQGNEQKRLESQIKKGNRYRDVDKNDWKLTSNYLEIVQQYTNVDNDTAMKSYYNNFMNMGKTIINIIWTAENDHNARQKNDSKILTRKPTTGGRVQSAYGYAHEATNSFTALEKKRYLNGNDKSMQSSPYVYNPNTEETKKVSEILTENPIVKCISRDFLKKALKFYNGDMKRTLSVILFIIDLNASKDTYCRVNASKDCAGYKHHTASSYPKAFKQKTPSAGTIALRCSDFQSEEHYKIGCEMIETILIAPRLDFHGFIPEDAIQILKICLKKWWNHELLERELKAQKLSISKAFNVSAVEVVTGRGIHSVGGVSVLRKRVKMFLDRENYLYWEEPSYFIVTGKKPVK